MTRKLQLPLQTMNLVVGFMVWVIISSLLPFIQEDVAIAPERVALVTAVPVILGSILRIPLGYFANVYGARIVFIISFILLMFPVFYISEASTFADLLIGGLFLGVGGAIFSVGVTSLPKYYPKEKHGLVNGVYGAGNIGTAVTTFAAPVIATSIGWQATIKVYLVLLLAFAVLNIFIGDRNEKKVKQPIMQQIQAVYKNEKLWIFSLFYFITFGSFVAFTVYLPNSLVTNFGLEEVDAGLRTAGFIVVATLMRPAGGAVADKFSPLKMLVGVFVVYTAAAILLAFSPSLALYTVGAIAIAVSAGVGNGVIFKLVPTYFHSQAGIANGIISMMGGLGGFFPPLILTAVFAITGHYAIGFMLLSQVSLASLILIMWLMYQDSLNNQISIFHSSGQGMMVTDTKGKIVEVNPSFEKLTGYSREEALGNTPALLKSGKQPKNFYDRMWESIRRTGHWQGEIWNRRKSGELYVEWLTINPVTDETGNVIKYVATFSDITEEKKEGEA
ncbi:nitrate/nitrite transporter [Salimicrobium humidisoli]|uniref:Nitrate/nitrite transporter n=1 Tax=Salimicrobium humidisoli TaxID=2029857 RepID=A0ABX4HVE7_9BACI|nr:nitrate/nitrite transporter [Salimicrobium humidisoli]PBB07018.1 nitrate/nitrite transporter [Salimicrobium humidisoli]